MIITLKGCTATAFIGGLNFFKISRGTVSGAVVTIATTTINKDEATSTSARELATVVLNSNYENLVVTVTMGGTTVNWFANGKVTIPANTTVTGDIKISASATAINTGGEVVNPEPEEPGTGGDTSTGGDSGETPSIPTTETWYIDHRNNVSKFSASVNIAGRGWCHIPNSNGYNAIVGKPINTIGVITNLETQNITIGVVTYKGNDTAMRTIGTYTLTNPNGTTKSFVSCKIDEVTLNNNECLALYAQEDDSIQFYYLSSGGPVTDANGIADGNFAGRVPKVYGSGSAWTTYTNSLTLGISYGYIPE
jgi:hypothetical protein